MLPDLVRARAESEGEAGQAWLASLDTLVAHFEAEWQCEIGEILHGGTESLVARLDSSRFGPGVIKIGLPTTADLAMEAKAYALEGGDGYASLLASDPSRNTLMIEVLGRPLNVRVADVNEQIRLICKTLARSWRQIAGDEQFMTGAEKARWLIEYIESQSQRQHSPFDQSLVHRAIDCARLCEERHDPETAVLVHGDAHAGNLLHVDGDDPDHYKFVDPDALFAEPACDLAIPMREWPGEMLGRDGLKSARARCEQLSKLGNVLPEAIWQWGFVESVSSSLAMLSIGMRDGVEDLLGLASILGDNLPAP